MVGVAPTQSATPPLCFGAVPTIVGTSGDDLLVGGDDTADVIVGLGGDDRIFGGDYFVGGEEADRLCGGPGNDIVSGSYGEDWIRGGGGNDEVDGSYRYDVVLRGGPGDDTVEDCDSEYSGSARLISGGAGNDSLCTDSSPAVLRGGQGDDTLVDLNCFEDEEARLEGGPGNDVFESWFGNYDGSPCSEWGTGDPAPDLLLGGAGHDTAVVSPADQLNGVETVEIR